jgi:hypothetical protein
MEQYMEMPQVWIFIGERDGVERVVIARLSQEICHVLGKLEPSFLWLQ